MTNTKNFNSEKTRNCFQNTEEIHSYLLYKNVKCDKKPWITVFVPTYKRLDLLKDAVNSILKQWMVDFYWDLLIVDNEPYDGEPNETEIWLRELDCSRITYYRNEKNMKPGDNFNRGILLAQGEWVMMLHDDDILITNSLQNMGRNIRYLQSVVKKPLGAISASYHMLVFDKEHPKKTETEMLGVNQYFEGQKTNYGLIKLTHNHILMSDHIGGDVPSNGTTYNRNAVLNVGGFNENLGICCDLILFYQLENKYSVYSTAVPYGFYRWGENAMANPDSTYKVIRDCFEFREYVYSKNIFTRIWGRIFRSAQYYDFSNNVIKQKSTATKEEIPLSNFNDIYSKLPNKFILVCYRMVKYIYQYNLLKRAQCLENKSKEIHEKLMYYNE